MYHTQLIHLDHTTIVEATFEGDLELDAPLLEQLARTSVPAADQALALLLVADNYCVSPSLIALTSRYHLKGVKALAICCCDEEVNALHRKHLIAWFPYMAVECFTSKADATNWLILVTGEN